MATVWRWVFLGLVAAASGGLVWAVRHREPPTPPVIDFQREIDLGSQPVGTIVHAPFRIDNRGGSVLSLTQFTTSCSCAGIEVEEGGVAKRVTDLHVPPGGYADLIVRIAVGARPGTPQIIGIAFTTNDPERPVATVRMMIPWVIGGVHAEPTAVVFGELPVGQPASRTVRLYENGVATRTVRQVRSLQPDQFSARLVPLDGTEPPHEHAGRVIAVLEIIPRTDRPQRLDGTVEIVSADETKPPDTLAVLGEVVPEVVARPTVLVLPRHVGGRAVYSGRVALSSRTGAELSSVTVESVPDGLTAAVRADPDSPGLWFLEVTARPSGPTPRAVAVGVRATLRPETAIAVDVPITLSPVAP